MAGTTNVGESAVLNHIFKGSAMAQPTAITVALFTTAPDPELGTGGVEVSGGSYARVACNAWTVSGTAPTQVANTSAINYVTPSAGWGLVTSYGVYFDGVLWFTGNLSASKTINSGDTVSFASGAMVFTLD